MNLWGCCLKMFGWKVDITAPRREKCVICVAPHTSNLDFILGILAYKSLGRNANFLMKDFWFFWPLGYLMRGLGGIPVPRKKKGTSLTQSVIQLFKNQQYVNLAVTPEGTRSAQPKWHTGFLFIAYGANVPVQLGIIDYRSKTIIIADEYYPSGNVDYDIEQIKNYYRRYSSVARYPAKFML